MRVGAVAWLVNGERQRNRSLLRTVFSMLRGHVDQITRRLVVGWALDDEKPDAVVDICLFVDGVNIAQVPCNIVRPDLRDARCYGEGRHGFRYEFASEFPPETQPRITLRFAATGGLLGNGDAVLAGGQAAATVPTDGQNVRLAANDARLRPLDWPPIAVDVRASDKLLSAMIERVESMFRHLGEVDPSESGAVADRYLAALITERDAAFFEFGKMPVRQFLATLARCGISKNGLDTCFELGCGVGRSTVWLAEQFRQVIAADISAPHLRATRENVGRFGRDNVTFVHTNKIDSLRELPPLDVFFSMVVLQHNPPPIMRHVLGILLSKLKPGGVGYFQVPTYRLGYRFDSEQYLAVPLKLQIPEMHVFPQPELHALFAEQDCRLIELREDPIPGNHISARVLVQRNGRGQ